MLTSCTEVDNSSAAAATVLTLFEVASAMARTPEDSVSTCSDDVTMPSELCSIFWAERPTWSTMVFTDCSNVSAKFSMTRRRSSAA